MNDFKKIPKGPIQCVRRDSLIVDYHLVVQKKRSKKLNIPRLEPSFIVHRLLSLVLVVVAVVV
jgi:hypothetical protein